MSDNWEDKVLDRSWSIGIPLMVIGVIALSVVTVIAQLMRVTG